MLQEAGFAAAAVTSSMAIRRHTSARRYTDQRSPVGINAERLRRLIAMATTLGVGFSAVWINRRRRRCFTHESEQARQSQKRTPVGL
jgi:hypothetical protein